MAPAMKHIALHVHLSGFPEVFQVLVQLERSHGSARSRGNVARMNASQVMMTRTRLREDLLLFLHRAPTGEGGGMVSVLVRVQKWWW